MLNHPSIRLPPPLQKKASEKTKAPWGLAELHANLLQCLREPRLVPTGPPQALQGLVPQTIDALTAHTHLVSDEIRRDAFATIVPRGRVRNIQQIGL